MKVSYLVIFSAVLGATLGGSITWINFGNSPPLVCATAATGQAKPAAGQPKVLVDEQYYDFGPVERDTKVSHVFRFTNIGTGVLTLKAGETTCSRCTISRLPKSELAPGESVDVTVEYEASYLKPQFQQIAPIITNDPDQTRVELNIAGTVTTKYDLVPSGVILSKISANGTTTGEMKILGYLADEIRVVATSSRTPRRRRISRSAASRFPRIN